MMTHPLDINTVHIYPTSSQYLLSTRPLTHILNITHPLIYRLTGPLTHPLTHPLNPPPSFFLFLIHPLTHSHLITQDIPTYALTHLLTDLLTHPLNHPPSHPFYSSPTLSPTLSPMLFHTYLLTLPLVTQDIATYALQDLKRQILLCRPHLIAMLGSEALWEVYHTKISNILIQRKLQVHPLHTLYPFRSFT